MAHMLHDLGFSSPKMAGWLRLGVGLALGGLFLAILANSVDLASVSGLLARAAWLPLLVALAAYAVDFVLRALRFWLLLGPAAPDAPRFWKTASPFVASFGISDILPFRIGDAFRVYWFHRKFGYPIWQLVSAMLIERVLDLVSILLLGSAALLAVDSSIPAAVMRQFQIVLTATTLLCLFVLLSPAVLDRIASWVERGFKQKLLLIACGAMRSAAAAIRSIGSLKRMASMLVMSVFLWLLESVVMLGAWISLGGQPTQWLKPFVAFAIATLGTLVPALPGHFGSYEYFGVLSFDFLGVDQTMAMATVLLAHLVLWLPTAMFGVVWLLASKDRLSRPVEAKSY
jgi:glycosyltransferase 2 family protein